MNSAPNTIAIAAGAFHSVALKADGTVWTWGTNYYGSLGNGTTTDSYTPTQVLSLTNVVAVAAGYYHTLALKADGTVWAWGANDSGQLGNPSVPVWVPYQAGYSVSPVQVSGLTGIVAIAAGKETSLAVASDGTVWAWGNGSTVPVQVTGLSGVVAVAGGTSHSLALKADGTVWAWGQNGFGALGNGTQTDSSVPVQVSGLSGVQAIAAGYRHSLALKADGTVWAWGDNGYYQLGNGGVCATPNIYNNGCLSTIPVQVSGLSSITSIAAGGADSIHSLAVRSDGTVWAWGYNGDGELGNGNTDPISVPVQVSGLTNAEAVAGAVEHSLALVGNPDPSLTLSAPNSSVAQTLAVTGTSFSSGEAVKLYWDSTASSPLTTTVATARSTLVTRLTVPPTTAGSHNIIAVGQNSGKIAYGTVRVKPRLFLPPYTGAPGATVRALGLGFSPGEAVKLYWDKPAQPLGTATSTSLGGFYGTSSITFTVPLTATSGLHVVYGVGQNSHAVGIGVFSVH